MDENCSTMNVSMEENIMTSGNRTELWVFTKENHLVRTITGMIMMGPKSKSFSIVSRANSESYRGSFNKIEIRSQLSRGT